MIDASTLVLARLMFDRGGIGDRRPLIADSDGLLYRGCVLCVIAQSHRRLLRICDVNLRGLKASYRGLLLNSLTEMSTALEEAGLINNGDGITLTYVLSVLESSFFSVAYTLQNDLNHKKLYRKNYAFAAFQCLLDYLHVIPFLVHGESLTSINK